MGGSVLVQSPASHSVSYWDLRGYKMKDLTVTGTHSVVEFPVWTPVQKLQPVRWFNQCTHSETSLRVSSHVQAEKGAPNAGHKRSHGRGWGRPAGSAIWANPGKFVAKKVNFCSLFTQVKCTPTLHGRGKPDSIDKLVNLRPPGCTLKSVFWLRLQKLGCVWIHAGMRNMPNERVYIFDLSMC